MVPALLLPVTAALVRDEVDAVEPLGALHPVVARNHDPCGEAMAHGEGSTVQVVRHEDLRGPLDEADWNALRITVSSGESDPRARGLGRGQREKVGQPDAREAAGAHQPAADVVADAL